MPHGWNSTSTTGYGYNQRTPKPLDEPTQKLFKAINDENLEAFKQALKEGADVNKFDEEGMTPLISIAINLSAGFKTEKEYQNMIRLLLLHQSIGVNIREQNNGDTALHLAMCFQQKKTLQLLLSHPNIIPYLINKKQQNPEECARQNRAEYLIIEIQKAQKGRKLLDALSSGNIYQAKGLLNQELNPNCWKRSQSEEIETPLSLIIQSCLQGITSDNKEVLTKLLKHKELDFSQIKPIQAIERNSWVKRIIEQAIKERLTATINKKDLDDVKKLVEDNCFMSHAIVTAALRGVNNSIESITNYLNEKFSANTNNIPKDFEGFVEEFERKEAQLTEKKKELKQKKLSQQAGVNDLSSQLTQLSKKIDQSRKQYNYAVASLVLSAALVAGACLTTPNLEICIPLAVTAFAFFTIGCYCSYKTKTALSDVRSTQLGNVISLE
ncbi:ankyrin repeat domain-containing protein [Wolbachia pipientis]|uniref:ankyrin repeat domain-containing protein n=1 Tax=Wolbachia pipientis TaxID=955 RepID=UPI0016518354|nr:ankyrin repeat domain-containing protein [Wolbachia pipientis]MBC6686625.1 ankyrin repeat domain-containing protein [Wolbachia pipientis]